MSQAKENKNPRLGKVGGEAVLEGVMMRAGSLCAIACRHEDGSLVVREKTYVSARKKHKFCNLPIIRGIVSFIESLLLSYSCLTMSAEEYGEVEEPTKFEKWFKKHLGIQFFDVITVLAMILGVGLALFLFLALPRAVAGWIEGWFSISLGVWKSAVEGGLKIAIFVLYLYLVSLMKDIRRTFAYHGAEHKSIACYEAGDELTAAAARKYTRFHPRCGTSFMFVMILLGVLLGFLINAILPNLPTFLYTLVRLLLLPLVVGLGFEFIIYAGKHDNIITRTLSAPGLWMQRITTREPDDQMLEVALLALQYALIDDFPDFDRAAYKKQTPIEEKAADAPAEEKTADAPADVPKEPSADEKASAAPTEASHDTSTQNEAL